MNVTKSVESRTVDDIRYVEVANLAALDTPRGVDLLASGASSVKVVKLVKGGYSVRPIGRNAIYSHNGNHYTNYGSLTRYYNAGTLLRVDGESTVLSALFN